MRRVFEVVRIFAGMSAEALAFLDGLAKDRPFAPGEVLVEEGSLGNTMFLLEAGRVVVSARPDEGAAEDAPEVVLGELGPLDYFGEMALIEPVRRSATVRAVEGGSAVVLSSLNLHKLYTLDAGQYAILILNLARDLCRRVRSLDRTVAARALYSGPPLPPAPLPGSPGDPE